MKSLLLLISVFCVVLLNGDVSVRSSFDDHESHIHQHIGLDDAHHRHVGEAVGGEVCAFRSPSENQTIRDKKNMNEWRIREESKSIFERSSRKYTIPVYYHIIQTSATTGMVSDTRIRDFIDYLNDSFKNSAVPFTFEYMGVTRTVRADWDNCYDNTIELEFKTALKVGGGDTLNIYICNKMYTDKGASITGYATGPTASSSIYDGIVINNEGGEERLNTLVHETGHFLGLQHTFGENTCDSKSEGDLVDDTPQHISRASEVNCHSSSTTWDTCPLLTGLDPNDNFMNYANDLLCRTRFTRGQKERMIAQYELYRIPQQAPVPIRRPAPLPIRRPAPIPVRRPPPIPFPRPVPAATRPRPSPTAPKITYVVPPTKCANLLSRCTAQKRCCGPHKCRFNKGLLSSIFGGRCFFF